MGVNSEVEKYFQGKEGVHGVEYGSSGGSQFVEVPKHFMLSEGVVIPEPILGKGQVAFSLNGTAREFEGIGEIESVRDSFAQDLEDVAPDLKSHGLAREYTESLFRELTSNEVSTNEELILSGMNRFYSVGRDVLGPLAVGFVDNALKSSQGSVVFPARDATPFYYIAKTLTTLAPGRYPVSADDIHNSVFNRKLWGIEDEQDPESEVLPVTHPTVQKLLRQMGFGSGEPVTFIEVGCWGSMVDQLNEAVEQGKMPKQEYGVQFLYTHQPDNIYGYTNLNSEGIPESVLETIADTWEAFPKIFRRPTRLIEDKGIVKADANGKVVSSEYMSAWQLAALQGVVDAAIDFIDQDIIINPRDEIMRLWELSNESQSGVFTGVLPGHTETWSEGADWMAKWRWGKVLPLK